MLGNQIPTSHTHTYIFHALLLESMDAFCLVAEEKGRVLDTVSHGPFRWKIEDQGENVQREVKKYASSPPVQPASDITNNRSKEKGKEKTGHTFLSFFIFFFNFQFFFTIIFFMCRENVSVFELKTCGESYTVYGDYKQK